MDPRSLRFVFDGWEGHNLSLRTAIEPRSVDELRWRPNENLPSVGEVFGHLAIARLIWFARMDAPLGREIQSKFDGLRDANRNWIDPEFTCNAPKILELLDAGWATIEATLDAWTVDDLTVVYPHDWDGVTHAVSRQWTIWRVLSHDIHHGGQICEMLYQQGIEIPMLGHFGGHTVEPPLWT